jgi:nitrite reductase/ring-hydroxylating ferredoxin subunit
MSFKVGKTDEIAPGQIKAYDPDGESIAIANVDGKLFAFSNVCTHAGCPLDNGVLDGTTLTCLCHSSEFDVSTGAVVSGPASSPIETFVIEVVGDELWIRNSEAEHTSPAQAPTSIKDVLAKVPLFSGLSEESLEALEAFTFRRTFAPQELIVEEGRTGNGLYVILSGRVEVIKGLGGSSAQILATLEQNEPFGEMALLGEWKRSASVRAVQETECIGIDRWVFLTFLEREPQIAIKMLELLAERLAEADEKLLQ